MAAPPEHAPFVGIVDATTIGLALVIVGVKVIARWQMDKKPASVPMCGVDFLHGSVVLPFLMMIGAVFSDVVYDYLKSASALTTALAGGIGLFFLIGELSKLD